MKTFTPVIFLALTGLLGAACVNGPEVTDDEMKNPTLDPLPPPGANGTSNPGFTPPPVTPAPGTLPPAPGVVPPLTPPPVTPPPITPPPFTPGTVPPIPVVITPIPPGTVPGAPAVPMGVIVPIPPTGGGLAPGVPGVLPGVLPGAPVLPGAMPVLPGGTGTDEWNAERVRSGSRLKAIFAVTAEGGKYFQYEWMDTALQARCRFAVAADGQQRCLPLPPRNALDGGLIRYFKDDSCNEPLYPASNQHSACQSGVGTRRVDGNRYEIYSFDGSKRYDRAYRMQPDADGRMVCRATEVVGNKDFYNRGREIAPGTFVATTSVGAEPVNGRRIWPIVRTTQDGMRVRTGWWDSRLQQECTLRQDAAGNFRCLPYLVFKTPLPAYADRNCDVPAAIAKTDVPNIMVQHVQANQCPAFEFLFRTEILHGAEKVYRKVGDRCEAADVPAGSNVYAVREQINVLEFVQWNETRANTGRLQGRMLTSSEGAIERPAQPFDSMLGDVCEFSRSDAGGTVCLPVPEDTSDALEQYSDSSCSQRAMRPLRGLTCNASNYAGLVDGPWCQPVVRAKTLAGVVNNAYHRDDEGQCEESKGGSYRAVGGDVPATSFVPATDQMLQ